MQDIVQVKDLVKRYGDLVAVDHCSLNVREGEIFGLLGPNGSGKSTLIGCLLSLLIYDHGEVFLFGEKMDAKRRDLKQQIGLVPQQVAVYEELTVEENIDYFTSLYIADPIERKKAVAAALQFTNLEEFRRFLPAKLSGGLLRRLNLAIGIAHRPRLLILDEPTVAVDPQSRNRILEGILEMQKHGTTVIYTSHYMEEIEQICDRLVILDHGKVLVEGTKESILAQTSLHQTLEIETPEISPALLQELETEGSVLNPVFDGHTLSLQLREDGMSTVDLIHFLEARGATLFSFSAHRPTLNDVFLEITGKELRDHA